MPLKIIHTLFCVSAAFGCAHTPSPVTSTTDSPLDAYVSDDEFGLVRLSPDGDLVAASMYKDGKGLIGVVQRSTMKLLSSNQFPKDFVIDSIYWMTPNQLVFTAVKVDGYADGRHHQQYIYTVGADGKGFRRLYPIYSPMVRASEIPGRYVRLAADDLVDGRRILVAEEKYNSRLGNTHSLLAIDIFNGSVDVVEAVQGEDFSQFAIDNQHRARMAVATEKTTSRTVWVKNLKSGQWEKTLMPGFLWDVDIVGFAADDRTFYYVTHNYQGLKTLYKNTLGEDGIFGKPQEVFAATDSDVSVFWDTDIKAPMFVEYGLGQPQRTYLTKKGQGPKLEEIQKSFPGELVYPTGRDGNILLLGIRSDRRPKTYYVFDQTSATVKKLLSANDKIAAQTNAPARPIQFRARDGVPLHGFLYQPNPKGPAPLVIHIHGGPFGLYDDWNFSKPDQFLVQNGFAVLKLNYRGSGGRGYKFEEMGYKNLGTKMQSDIADAAQWAIDTGVTEKGRICTYGGSYGAYSAVFSATLFPDLIQCAVGLAGMYDIPGMMTNSDWSNKELTMNYVKKMYPETLEEQKNQSPLYHAAKLNRPVFIAHGTDDVRCSVLQARALKAELQKHKKPFKYKEYADAGHGFHNPEQLRDFSYEMVSFLKENIK